MAVTPLLMTWSGLLAVNWMTQVGSPVAGEPSQDALWFSHWSATAASVKGSALTFDQAHWSVWKSGESQTNAALLRLKVIDARASAERAEILILKVAGVGDVLWKVDLQRGTVYSQEFGTESLERFIERVRLHSGGA